MEDSRGCASLPAKCPNAGARSLGRGNALVASEYRSKPTGPLDSLLGSPSCDRENLSSMYDLNE